MTAQQVVPQTTVPIDMPKNQILQTHKSAIRRQYVMTLQSTIGQELTPQTSVFNKIYNRDHFEWKRLQHYNTVPAALTANMSQAAVTFILTINGTAITNIPTYVGLYTFVASNSTTALTSITVTYNNGSQSITLTPGSTATINGITFLSAPTTGLLSIGATLLTPSV